MIFDPHCFWQLWKPECEHCGRGEEQLAELTISKAALVMLTAAGFEPRLPMMEDASTGMIQLHLDNVRRTLDAEATKYAHMIQMKSDPWRTYGAQIDNFIRFRKAVQENMNGQVRWVEVDDDSR